jgi:hypothetical protein
LTVAVVVGRGEASRLLPDDALITLTYAKSIAAGKGFIFNHPPASLGTTSPLLAMLVALLHLVLPFVSLEVLVISLSTVCWLGASVLVVAGRKSLHLGRWPAVTVAAVVFVAAPTSSLAMEAHLFTFLLVLCLFLFARKSWLLCGISCGLLFLTRGEGLLVAALIAACVVTKHLLRSGRVNRSLLADLARFALGLSIVLLPWLGFSHWQFGAFLPDTLGAKKAQFQSGIWPSFARRLWLEWVPRWGGDYPGFTRALSLWWALIILGVARAVRRDRGWLILVFWSLAYIVAYSLLKVAGYWWYQFPVLFALHVLLAFGILEVAHFVKAFSGRLHAAIGVGVLFLGAVLWIEGRGMANSFHRQEPLTNVYREIAHWMSENTAPDQSLAYIEIGTLGFYSENRIIDLAGLVTPALIDHIAAGDFTWGFWHYKPDFYIHCDRFSNRLGSIPKDRRFREAYRPIKFFVDRQGTSYVLCQRIK